MVFRLILRLSFMFFTFFQGHPFKSSLQFTDSDTKHRKHNVISINCNCDAPGNTGNVSSAWRNLLVFYLGVHVNRSVCGCVSAASLLEIRGLAYFYCEPLNNRQWKLSFDSILGSYQQHYYSLKVYICRICHGQDLFLNQHVLLLFQNKSPHAFFSVDRIPSFLNKAFILKYLQDSVVENAVTCRAPWMNKVQGFNCALLPLFTNEHTLLNLFLSKININDIYNEMKWPLWKLNSM